MSLSQEQILGLLPDRLPSVERLNHAGWRHPEHRRDESPWALRCQAWTSVIAWDIELDLRDNAELSVGLVAVPTPTTIFDRVPLTPDDADQFFGFGVIVEVDAASPPRESVLEICGEVFVELRRPKRRVQRHVHHVTGGLSACNVEPRSGSTRIPRAAWSRGVVTARHVISGHYSLSAITPVSLSAGHTGYVADYDAVTIDAAVVGEMLPLPAARRALNVVPFTSLYAGIDTEMVDHSGTSIAGQIQHVAGHPHYTGNRSSHRIYTDTHGVAGDSGSLLYDRSNPDEGLGVYVGSVPSTGGSEGQHQTLQQVADYFQVDCFL